MSDRPVGEKASPSRALLAGSMSQMAGLRSRAVWPESAQPERAPVGWSEWHTDRQIRRGFIGRPNRMNAVEIRMER